MGNNHRPVTTVTRSLSFRMDVREALDLRVTQERTDRSSFVNDVMEHVLGIKAHPEINGLAEFVSKPQ